MEVELCKTLGFALAVTGAHGRQALTGAIVYHEKDRSQGGGYHRLQSMGEDRAVTSDQWRRLLIVSLRPSFLTANNSCIFRASYSTRLSPAAPDLVQWIRDEGGFVHEGSKLENEAASGFGLATSRPISAGTEIIAMPGHIPLALPSLDAGSDHPDAILIDLARHLPKCLLVAYIHGAAQHSVKLRGNGMARWIWFFYEFLLISRTKSPCSHYPRINEFDRSILKEYRPAPLLPVDYGARVGSENYQIFINLPTGNPILVWVNVFDSVETLRARLASRVGYPVSAFYLVHAGKSMQDSLNLSDYQITKNCSISMLLRLRGGADGRQRGSVPSNKGTGPSSYKDAARSKGPQAEATPIVQPSPYIVEKLESTPVLEIKNEQVKGLFSSLQAEAVICRFNGFWPKSQDLHAWIYQNWTTNCQILLCSKGFFIVLFDSPDEYQQVLLQGPWFWGRAGLFLTPWFPEFDANTMVVTKMPVWVRLPNLPLPYWQHSVLEDIGNLLGRFIKSDNERKEKGLFTYARICVEIDLSKGLPDRLYLKHESYTWLQILDYENTAFRCRFCHMTGHLQDTCLLAKKFPKKKKGSTSNRKNWQSDYAPYPEEEEGREDEEQQGMQSNEGMVHDDEEAQTTGEQMPGVDTQTKLENLKAASASSQEHNGDSLLGKGTQTALVVHKEAPINGIKRGHESEKSDSDKELPPKPEMVNGRQVIVATTSQGRWMEVKNKRKGKKGKIEAYYQP